MGVQFFKQDEQNLISKPDKKFVCSKMEGDWIKPDVVSLFINKQTLDEQDKEKGFSVNAKDLGPLIEMLLRMKAKYPQ